MSIPIETIRLNIKEKRITRINQLFEYSTIPEWKEHLGLVKGVLERLIEDPGRFKFRYIWKIAVNIGVKETVIERLIEEQKKYNKVMKREGGQPGEPQGLRPGE